MTLVAEDLFHNAGARINEIQLEKSWPLIEKTPALLQTLVQRGGLPLAVAEKMLHAVTGELKQQLISRYKLDIPTAYKAAGDVREWGNAGPLFRCRILPTRTAICRSKT